MKSSIVCYILNKYAAFEYYERAQTCSGKEFKERIDMNVKSICIVLCTLSLGVTLKSSGSIYGVSNKTSCRLQANVVISLYPDIAFEIPPQSNRALEPFSKTCAQSITITVLTGKFAGKKITYKSSLVERCTTIAVTVGEENGKLYLQRCTLSLTNKAYVPTTQGWLYTAPLIVGCFGSKIYAESTQPVTPPAQPEEPKKEVRTGDLSNTSFKGQRLSNIMFENAILKGADFTDANLVGIIFKNSDIRDALFIRSKIMSTTVSGCNLSGATFDTAEINESDLRNADMQTTIIMHTKISRCNCEGTNFQHAQIAHTQFLETYGSGTIFSNSRILNCLFKNAQIDGGNFTNANFTPETPFTVGWFSTSNEQKTIFSHVNLTNADFSEANLTGVNFEGETVLVGTKFIGALLCNTQFSSRWRPNLTGTKKC